MNRNEAKKLWPIIKAYSNGKVVQKYITDDFNEKKWVDINTLVVSEMVYEMSKYRIKPTPTYRPFANAEECWEEMMKHEPFGWVKGKATNADKVLVIRVIDGGIALYDNTFHYYETVQKLLTFADGSVFGKLTEEG